MRDERGERGEKDKGRSWLERKLSQPLAFLYTLPPSRRTQAGTTPTTLLSLPSLIITASAAPGAPPLPTPRP
jgi:hypothetical protein